MNKSFQTYHNLALALSLAFCCTGQNVFAQSSKQLIVSVDNPGFRKLIVALPSLVAKPGSSSEVSQIGVSAAKELARLLTFCGLFQPISEDSYKGFPTTYNAQATGFDGIDSLQWKAIGVESLTVGEIAEESDGLNISLRTLDINRKELLLGKRYSKVAKNDINAVVRRYADLILKAYTGKPGIFSTNLVFVGRRTKNEMKQVFISDFEGQNLKQITRENTVHISPSFSPDGKFVTYTSYEDGNPDLFIYEVATGKKRKLSGKKGINSGAQWAPNGKVIAFSGSVEGDTDIYTVKPNGSDRKLLIRGSGVDVDPTFSPDGKWMSFVSGRFGNPHIFRAAIDWKGDSEFKILEDKRLTYVGWWNATPSFSPDSDKIAFAGFDKDINRFDIFMMNPDGSNLQRLTIRLGDNENPSWSPNGQMLVFHSNRSKGADIKDVNQLWVMNRDGSNQRQLITGLYEAATPKWGPAVE